MIKLRHATSSYNLSKTVKHVHKEIHADIFTIVLFETVQNEKQNVHLPRKGF